MRFGIEKQPLTQEQKMLSDEILKLDREIQEMCYKASCSKDFEEIKDMLKKRNSVHRELIKDGKNPTRHQYQYVQVYLTSDCALACRTTPSSLDLEGFCALSGNSYPHKEKIKSLGGKWNDSYTCWMIPVSAWEELFTLCNKK